MLGIDRVLRSENTGSSPPRFWSRDLAPEFLGVATSVEIFSL